MMVVVELMFLIPVEYFCQRLLEITLHVFKKKNNWKQSVPVKGNIKFMIFKFLGGIIK